jgi:hypothetical protein
MVTDAPPNRRGGFFVAMEPKGRKAGSNIWLKERC